MSRIREYLTVIACLGSVLSSGNLVAQGVLLPAGGAVNRGMGGATTGAAIDPIGSMYWNPATINQFDGDQVGFGFELIYGDQSLSSAFPGAGAGSTDADTGAVPVPTISWVHHTDNPNVTIGLGIFGIGGFAMELDEIAEMIPAVSEEALFYYFLLATVVGSYLVARRMMRAPFGSVLQSIRESERRTEFVGYDVTAYKRRAFVVSGAMAGLAGGLFAVKDGFVAPSLLFWLNSGEVVVMTVLGGMGTLYGPMVGAGVYIGFEEVLSSYTDQWQFFLGALFVLFVIALPRGLVSLPEKLADLGGRAGASADAGAGPSARDEEEPLAERADGEVNE